MRYFWMMHSAFHGFNEQPHFVTTRDLVFVYFTDRKHTFLCNILYIRACDFQCFKYKYTFLIHIDGESNGNDLFMSPCCRYFVDTIQSIFLKIILILIHIIIFLPSISSSFKGNQVYLKETKYTLKDFVK
eukprot:760506_1